MASKLHIERFVLGDWMTNCYVLSSGEGRCWIVDAGFDPEPMIAFVQEQGLEPVRVVLTHAHVDHIAGLGEVRRVWPDLPILIHEAEQDFLGDAALNLSIVLAQPVVAPEPTDTLTHGQRLELDSLSFEVRHTPGHSPGGICLYQADHETALVGDTLFAGSIGRHDFPTSDGQTLLRSIREQLLTLPEPTRVLPGHGPQTSIGREKASNPYLR